MPTIEKHRAIAGVVAAVLLTIAAFFAQRIDTSAPPAVAAASASQTP